MGDIDIDIDAEAAGAAQAPARFTVLGLLAIADNREVAVLQPSKPAALLAALLVRPNTVVSVDSLQRVIWGDDTPVTAKAALQTCVLRLRRLFGKYGISGSTIEAVPGGYRMAADARTLDLLRFREILRQAAGATEPPAELELLRSALALWQLPLLANVHSDALHRDDVPGLTEEWLRTSERIFDIELALGRCREVLADLRPVAHAHPLHERFSEQLVEALHRSGRRGEALAEYRRVKNHLLAELGVDPGPGLQRLELVVLRGDPWPADVPGPPVPARRRAPLAPSPGYGPGHSTAPDRVPPGRAGRPAGPAPHETATRTPDDPHGRANLREAGPATGELVLASLVQAGLLEEAPHGRYRVHDLLRTFTRAAAGSRPPAAGPPLPAPAPAPAPASASASAPVVPASASASAEQHADRPADHPTDHRTDHQADRRVLPADHRRGRADQFDNPRQAAAPLRTTEV